MSKTRKPAAAAHCRVTPLHWSRYLEGEFSTAECRRCEAHLKTCAACRSELQGLERVVRTCRDSGRRAVPATLKAEARQRAKALIRKASR
ncbi:MAG: anti-sigma factor [Vicinamibacterales bacterium]